MFKALFILEEMPPKLSAPILVLPLQTSKELCFVAQMIFFSIDDKEKHSLDRVQNIEGLTLKK